MAVSTFLYTDLLQLTVLGYPHDIYKCHSSFRSLDDSRNRYEVRIYLSEDFSGHQFELVSASGWVQ